jgi:mono/diheme cytochrome c family protein
MRVQIEIMLGFVLTMATFALLLIAGINEPDRMDEYVAQQKARSIEAGAALYDQACKDCHGPQGKGVPGLCPPLNSRAFFTDRLTEVGWSGGLRDYIIATVASGRVVSTRPDQYVGGGNPAMPGWSEEYGGPFRVDQLENLADYILNWEQEAMEAPDEPEVVVDAIGTDINIALPEGNIQRGEATATVQGCTACHISTPAGPAWLASASEPGIGTRAALRIQEADYTGNATSAEQYLLESIVQTDVYVVPGYSANIMPDNYGAILTLEQVADMIAYLMSLE